MIKRNALFDRFEEDWKIMLSELCRNISADRNRVDIPVFEEQGVCIYTRLKLTLCTIPLSLEHAPFILLDIFKLI